MMLYLAGVVIFLAISMVALTGWVIIEYERYHKID